MYDKRYLGDSPREERVTKKDGHPDECSPSCCFWPSPRACSRSTCPLNRSIKAPKKEIKL